MAAAARRTRFEICGPHDHFQQRAVGVMLFQSIQSHFGGPQRLLPVKFVCIARCESKVNACCVLWS